MFKECLRELTDDILPLRAFAMSKIRAMVLQRKPYIKDKLEIILELFIEQIKHEDSFVYLNAVKGLCALTANFTNETLSAIAAKYTQDALDLDYRLRIGEALRQSIQNSGEVFGKYGETVLPVIFKTMRHESEIIRSSSLSLLSQVAETDPYAILPYIHQLADYFHTLLDLEKVVETRRGVVGIIVFLFQGLGMQVLKSLPTEVLRSFYRDLKYVSASDSDSLTRGHACVALEEINEIMTSFLKGY